jgi:glutathione peroxidase
LDFYDIDVTGIDGSTRSMAVYRGKTLLIVNVASKCGYTPQYAGLEALYRKYAAKGLVVLGFPCDQFGHQEPGTDAEIRHFCSTTYAVTFPMFTKVKVNGEDAHPLYKFLKAEKRGILRTAAIKWNFNKFLVSAEGVVMRRYASSTTPERIDTDIARLLA